MSNYYNPVKIIKTKNWLHALNSSIENLNIFSPIIVTSIGNRKRLRLDTIFDAESIFSDIGSNPNFEDCMNAVEFCKKNMFDGVIALGGGSAMDLAKVIMAHLCLEKSNIYELIGYKDKFPQTIPSIFLPTTHGTGSEVTMWGTIWNMGERKKYSISHQDLYPNVAILDGKLLLTLPLDISITTVLDALSHSFESIWNKNANNKSTEYAIKAISIILQNIEGLKEDPYNADIRNNLLEASTTSGLAFSNTKTAAAHSMSYPLTINYGIPHGIASSICLIPLLEFNRKLMQSSLEKICHSNSLTYKQLIGKIESIPHGIIPYTLNKWGVKEHQIDELVNMAFISERMDNNIKNLTKKDVKIIFTSVFN